MNSYCYCRYEEISRRLELVRFAQISLRFILYSIECLFPIIISIHHNCLCFLDKSSYEWISTLYFQDKDSWSCFSILNLWGYFDDELSNRLHPDNITKQTFSGPLLFINDAYGSLIFVNLHDGVVGNRKWIDSHIEDKKD